MANTFKVVTYSVSASLTDFYTAPAATTTIVLGCQAANMTPSSATWLTLTVRADGTNDISLVEQVAVPAKSTISPVTGKLVLEAGDILKARTASADDLHLTLSILEIS